ncbi:hypothetical protein WT56_05720 [Burkholderia pseudomultivorans]|uniref:Uncharacterized protein n=1 Tax=Burkholderia pseudomultivorans TaxID=1207504 RepID=A0A132ENU1_9BURK|nr:hypothetical protein WT56_05720 [Burkholderia pseudomultivorans]
MSYTKNEPPSAIAHRHLDQDFGANFQPRPLYSSDTYRSSPFSLPGRSSGHGSRHVAWRARAPL